MNIRDIPFPTSGGQYTSDGVALTPVNAPASVAAVSSEQPTPLSESAATAPRARRTNREESSNG